ncbi:flippase-like domain-containing protein [Acetobacteraceae bacterium]|nr:flippase-like domain-containing protein [Acetobacteraceae bacterium]
MKKKILKVLFAFAVSGVFLALFLHGLNWHEVWEEMKQVKVEWFGFAVLSIALSFFLRGERWRQILKPLNSNVPTFATWRIFILGIAANSILPFRLGDVLRGTIFSKKLGVPVGALMTSILIEKMCDLIFIVLLGGFALLVIPKTGHAEFFNILGTLIFAVGFTAIIFLFCARWFRRPVVFTLVKILKKTPKISEKLLPLVGHIFDALDMVARPSVMLRVMLFSALTWLGEWGAFVLVALGTPSLVKPTAAFLAMPMATLSTAIPAAPGAIGTFDEAAKKAMSMLGNTSASAAAYALLIHAVIWAAPIIMAFIALIGFRWKKAS